MTELTEEFHSVITAVLIGFLACDVVGCIGNITVIYIYSLRYPKNLFRFLVLALGIVDLTSCCTTVPMEIVSTWLWFDAPSNILCKAKNFCIQFTALSAMYMLFVMAVYKYRLICKPFGTQLTQRKIMFICGIGIVNSLVFATPSAYFWDVNTYTYTVGNETEISFICEVQGTYLETPYPRIYRHILSLYDVFLFTTIVLYILVAKTIIIYIRRKEVMKSGPVVISNPEFSNKVIKIDNAEEDELTNDTELDFNSAIEASPSRLKTQNKTDIEQSKPSPSLNIKQCTPPTSSVTAVSSSSSQLTPVQIRKVIIMVILSGTFAFTFLLGQIFGYTFAVRGFEDYDSLEELRLLYTFDRLYFVNYAINPIVYFALDKNFRKEVTNLFRCLRKT